MSEAKNTTRVGLFMLLGLVLLAVLMINFSKGGFFMKPTYKLFLHTSNVGGIKSKATVLMAGVPIGVVDEVNLVPDGKNVEVILKIYTQYPIRKGARFTIEQAGFLGDQFVAVDPQKNEGAYLNPGDTVTCDAPFNLQETARKAGALLEHASLAVEQLKGAMSNMNRILLSEVVLSNISTNLVITANNIRYVTESAKTNIPGMLTNLNVLSGHARQTVQNVDMLVQAQTSAVAIAIANLNQSVSNFEVFSLSLKSAGSNVDGLISSNGPNVTAAIKNIETASGQVTNMLRNLQADLDSGKGLVGALMKDGELKQKADELVTSMSAVSLNLEVATSNLNRNGLWWMLWKPKLPKTNTSVKSMPSEAGKK